MVGVDFYGHAVQPGDKVLYVNPYKHELVIGVITRRAGSCFYVRPQDSRVVNNDEIRRSYKVIAKIGEKYEY